MLAWMIDDNGVRGELVGTLPSALTFFASFGDDILDR
jgi:hypothetical protein